MDSVVIDFWHWFGLAVMLLIIEIIAPAFFALWLAIASLVTGIVLFFMPDLSWQIQFILFALVAVISISVWRKQGAQHASDTDQPFLNRRAEQYIGRIIVLKHPIINGVGKVQLDDSTWKVTGDDCAEGTKVKIVRVDNVVFTIEKVA